MLFEMLSGRPSFARGPNVDIMLRIVREGLDLGALREMRVPPALAEIVRRATARRPVDRYPSALAMLEDLEGFAAAARFFTSPTRLAHHLRGRDLFC
jgi:serine/threonine-protein kinase